MGYYCYLAMKKFYLDDKCCIWKKHLSSLALLSILVICFPLYMLADNAQPLDCAWGCDFVANKDMMGCEERKNSAMKLSFVITTLIGYTVIFAVVYVLHFFPFCQPDGPGQHTIELHKTSSGN